MDSRCQASHWITYLCLILLSAGAGCSEAVMLTHESERGGVMTYSYKEDRGGPMGSPYRRQAMDAIEAKCGTGSKILREGEVPGYTTTGMGITEGTEDESRGRRWGIQFECKVVEESVGRISDANKKERP